MIDQWPFGLRAERIQSRIRLTKDVGNNFAMHVSKTKTPTLIAEREPFMIDAHQVQNRRVQVVDVD